jgi:hypothetical protein
VRRYRVSGGTGGQKRDTEYGVERYRVARGKGGT